MDRLGDDLTELILQYLTFEDKIRLECVSKQWMRCVFTKQYKICVYFKSYKKNNLRNLYPKRRQSAEQILESVLKKCPNIKCVNLRSDRMNNSSVLSLIGRYCHRIKSLTYCPNSNEKDMNSLTFFRKYGHKLEELRLYGNSSDLEQILEYNPNLKKIRISEKLNSKLLKESKEFLPKIEEFEICPENVNQMKILSDKYTQTMKILNVKLFNMIIEELKTCIECIARFKNLKQLKLTMGFLKITEPIDDFLLMIGQKCNKLLKLDLSIDYSVPISDRFFKVFKEFKTLKKLKIILGYNTVLYGSVECFKHCKQLNDLHINYSELREDFFANIATFVPKLQSLCITTQKPFSDSFIYSLNSMKNLIKVYLNIVNNDMTAIRFDYSYFGKCYDKIVCETMDVIRIPIYTV